jgi:hypothetical protein
MPQLDDRVAIGGSCTAAGAPLIEMAAWPRSMEKMRKNLAIHLVGLLALPAPAMAGSCEDNFRTVGDPRNGLFFSSQVQATGTSMDSALGQLQQYALDGGYEVGQPLIVGDEGELSFVQSSSRPPLVIRATADRAGQVGLALKLARGQKTAPADVQSEFCGLLAKLKPGPEGEAIAAAARTKTGSDRAVDAKAVELSASLGKEVAAVLKPVASKGSMSRMLIGTGPSPTSGEFEEAFAPVRARYLGRQYRVDGQIYTVTRDIQSLDMDVNYLVTVTRGLLGVRQESSFNDLNFQIKCRLAKDQAAFFATLSEGNWVTLKGTVGRIDPGSLQLTECRQAN